MTARKDNQRSSNEEKQASAETELPGAELEKLVTLFQTLMAQGSKVSHNRRMQDRLGIVRQIDVLIEGTFAGWDVIGIIECRDNSRKKGLDAVEAFAKKTEHLGAGLRLMVSKKGFTKSALKLAKHERIYCLSLLPHDSHRFGFAVGEWAYGIVSRWVDLKLHVEFATPDQKFEFQAAESVLFQGKPVVHWFLKKFIVDFWDRTRDGDATIKLPFDKVTELEIAGKPCAIKGLATSARAVYLKKRRWVTYSGQGFFNWNSGKITVPSGLTVQTEPIKADLMSWDDYGGEIPPLGDMTGSKLFRSVAVLTQFFDGSLAVPELEVLSTGEPNVGVKSAVPPNSFDFSAAPLRALIDSMVIRPPPGK